MSKAKINVGILGASGYTGADAVRLLAAHPHVEITLLTGNAHADKSLAEIYPQFGGLSMPNLIKAEEADWRDIDAVICGLPHSTAQDVIATIPAHVRIIDMSADFRLRDSETYSQWYGRPHDQAALLSEAVYGLSEHYRDDIQKARLVACPGCYPTAALSALMPLLSAGLVTTQDRCEIRRHGRGPQFERAKSFLRSGRRHERLWRGGPSPCARNRARASGRRRAR
jgi:N-acetyl-gamma-glutamyl-phosphate reductase